MSGNSQPELFRRTIDIGEISITRNSLRSLISRIWRYGYRLVALLLTLIIVVLNVRLYVPDADDYRPDHVPSDALPQLNFIKQALQNGSGHDMQSVFPEGYFFSHVLYGLAWINVGLRQPVGSRGDALREARWALSQLDSPDGSAAFSPSLDPPYGVFYVGWTSWLRGGVLKLQTDPDPVEVARFEADCTALAAAFDRSASPFLQAYPQQAWPVDNVVAIAALRLHDSLLPARFDSVIARWLKAAQARLDPATGLLPHSADVVTGQKLLMARGSSQSIIARFLPEIDPVWGQQQYILFREQYIAPAFGVPGVREYPLGVDGPGDVDSGPLIAGFSASATVVTLGAAQALGDKTLADPIRHSSEAVGLPITWGDSKRYAFGLLPIGDAFLVWSKTAVRWIPPSVSLSLPPDLPPAASPTWRLPLHALALALICVLWFPIIIGHLRRQ